LSPDESHETLAAADQDELLATIANARISEPARMAAALKELRLESAAHIGRLDVEERYEMMAAMRSAGIALGSRNKLRLLATVEPQATFRRAQAEDSEINQQTDVRRDSATTQARERASDQGGDTQQENNRILGISGDSALHDYEFTT
jgi:hypothetical protein